MKDSRFIELLNLYVDREISREEAALLEQEILRDPSRKRIYQQYCRMSRASELLSEQFKSAAVPSGSVLAEAARKADAKVVNFPSQGNRRFRPWLAGFACAAAAACLAFVIVHREQSKTAPVNVLDADALAISKTPKARSIDPVAFRNINAMPVAVQTRFSEYKPVFVGQSIKAQDVPEQKNPLLIENKADLNWMKAVQVNPIQDIPIENLVFEQKPTLRQDPRTFDSGRPVQGKIENISFQIQK